MANNSLRDAGDADRITLGGIYVRADNVSIPDVVAAVRRFWNAAGAQEKEAAPDVAPGALKSEGLVGFVVVPASADIDDVPWIGIRDSVHYSKRDWADQLAEALNAYLSVATFSFTVGPKTRLVSLGFSHYFGLARKSTKSRENTVNEADRFPHPFFRYEDAKAIEGSSWLRFVIDAKVAHTMEFEKNFWKKDQT